MTTLNGAQAIRHAASVRGGAQPVHYCCPQLMNRYCRGVIVEGVETLEVA